MTKEMIIYSLDYIVEHVLTSKVTAYVSIEGKIYGYVPAIWVREAV